MENLSRNDAIYFCIDDPWVHIFLDDLKEVTEYGMRNNVQSRRKY
jgi:hypothetical protein